MHELTRALEVGPGLLRNCDISLGKICIVCGGFVSRNGIGWQRRSTSVRGWKQGTATSNLKSGTKKYVVIILMSSYLDLVHVVQETKPTLANFIQRFVGHNVRSSTRSRKDGTHGRMLARPQKTTLRLTSAVDESHIRHKS